MATVKQGLALAGVAGVLGLKGYALHRYLGWRRGRQPESSTGWNNRRGFGALPRRKQLQVIYGKRAQLKDFETIAYGGYGPRRRRRRRFGWGG